MHLNSVVTFGGADVAATVIVVDCVFVMTCETADSGTKHVRTYWVPGFGSALEEVISTGWEVGATATDGGRLSTPGWVLDGGYWTTRWTTKSIGKALWMARGSWRLFVTMKGLLLCIVAGSMHICRIRVYMPDSCGLLTLY